MKYGILRKKANYSRNRFFSFYFVGISLLILFIFIIYSNNLLINIREDVEIVPDLYSKFISLPDYVNLEDFLLRYFMTEIIPNINYPIILADSLKIPFSWENMRIDKKPFAELDEKDQRILLKKLKKLEKRKAVIPLRYDKTNDKVFSYVYYGESKTMKKLRMMPYLEMGLMIFFVLLGIIGLTTMKRTERNLLWVGLAKETAHQFGTPISSLLGWLDILSTRFENIDDDSEISTMLGYMKTDIDKLNQIASRFGKVGSSITHNPVDLHTTIQEAVEHFRRRLPTIANKTELIFNSEIRDKQIKLDPDLIKWTIENLIKNSIDAMQNRNGSIIISAKEKNGKFVIRISDQGIGLPKSMRRKIFYPGITSKQRGWGLGLSLAKRIVEEYHRGKIRVVESKIDEGTTFEIILPED